MSDWRPLKHFCNEPAQYGVNLPADQYVEQGLRLLRTTDTTADGTLTNGDTAVFADPDQIDSRYELRDGDLLLSRSGTLGRCVRYQASDGPATFAGYLVRFRPRSDMSSKYMWYCTRSWLFQGRVAADAISSTIANFNAERYSNLRMPWRPLDAQKAIANYLDAETARIDALIVKKQGLRASLDARFLQLTKETVTTGLELPDPLGIDSRLTNGEWRPLRLGRHVRLGSGTTPTAGVREYYDGTIPWVVTGDLTDDRLNQANKFLTERALRDFSSLRVHPPGTLIVAMYGATVGRLALADFATTTNQACCAIVGTNELDAEYMFYYLFAHRDELIRKSIGAGQPNISQEIVRSLQILAPSAQRQREIVRMLRGKRRQSDSAVGKLNRQIDLLREHRQALITAAVTGAFQVPGAA